MLKCRVRHLSARLPRRSEFSVVSRVALLGCLLGITALGGCAKKKDAAATPGPDDARAVFDAPVAKEGLEVWWWLADDSNAQVGAAIARLMDDTSRAGLNESQHRVWESNGLRWVRITAERLGELEREVRPLRVTARTAYGWPTSWTEIFRGSRVGRASGRAVLVTKEGGEGVTPGRLRMLTRCWEAPSAGPEGLTTSVRLELAVQSQTKGITPNDEPFAMPTVMPAEDQGDVLRPLTIETRLERGSAYVITSEKPGIIWGQSPEEALANATTYGPKGPTPTTVGEAMLTAAVPEQKGKVAKALVVLVVRGEAPPR